MTEIDLTGRDLLGAIKALAAHAYPIADAKHRYCNYEEHPLHFEAQVYPSMTPGEYALGTYAWHLTDEGFEFVGCDIFQDYYDRNHRRERTLVRWEEMEDPEATIATWKREHENRQRRQNEAHKKQMEEQLRRLAKELGKKVTD